MIQFCLQDNQTRSTLTEYLRVKMKNKQKHDEMDLDALLLLQTKPSKKANKRYHGLFANLVSL